MRGLHVASMQSRIAAKAVHFRLRLWLLRTHLLPMPGAPSFDNMEEHSNTLIKMYTSAEVLGRCALPYVRRRSTRKNAGNVGHGGIWS
jgi:hypothetical protein